LPAIDSISELAIGSTFSKLEGYNLYPVFYLDPKPDYYLLVYCQANPDKENEAFAAIVTVSKRDEIIDRMIVSQTKAGETTSKEIKTIFLDSTNFMVQTIIKQNGERINIEQKFSIDEKGRILGEEPKESKIGILAINDLIKQFRKAVFPDTIQYTSKIGEGPIDINLHSYLIPAIEKLSFTSIENLSGWEVYPIFYIDSKSDYYALVYDHSHPDESLPIKGLVTISKNSQVIDQIIVSEIGEGMDEYIDKYTVFENETSFTVITEHTIEKIMTTTREKYKFDKDGKMMKLSSEESKKQLE
jgi:hypothetical protein